MAIASYGRWDLVALNVALFLLFLSLIPLRREVRHKPTGVYADFVVALFAEMYGFPLTIYVLTWYFGYSNPLTHESGHLLWGGMFTPGHLFSDAMILTGALLVISGYRKIHKERGCLVTTGIYAHTRHPQYLGILILTLGLLLQWITIPALLMWPVLAYIYLRLARKEDEELLKTYGHAFLEYRRNVPMLLPKIPLHRTSS